MNYDITSISGTPRLSGLSSKPKVSMETVSESASTAPSSAVQDLKQFEAEMEQVNHGFNLVVEIRERLEEALRNLTP